MGTRRRFVLPIFLLATLSGGICAAQSGDSIPGPPELERVLPERAGESAGDQLAAEELEDRCTPPLDLNSAAADDLARLPFLAPPLARAIAARRSALGGFASWREVGGIRGLDAETLDALRRCAVLGARAGPAQTKEVDVRFRSRMQREERPRNGYGTGAYAGPREALATRLLVRAGKHARAGIAIERDAGERSATDHLAGHVTVQSGGAIETLTLGDFSVSEGQGLVFRKRSGFGKGGDAVAVTTEGTAAISPFASTAEAGSLRGAAARARFGTTELLAFVSSTRFDASVDSLTGELVSIDESGLHRTMSELRKADGGGESVFGGAASRAWRRETLELRAGMAGMASRFSARVTPASPLAFGGDRAWAIGAHVDLTAPGAHLFGEAARSHTGSTAGILGVTVLLPSATHATMVFRSYPPAFVSLHGSGFGERGGDTRNEAGVYFGLKWALRKTVMLQAAFDQFRFPGASYLIDVPASGHDAMVRAEWGVSERAALSIRWRREAKDASLAALDDVGREIRPAVRRTQESIRIEVRTRVAAQSELRIRAECARTAHGAFARPESGALLCADLRGAPWRALRLAFRAALFRTSSYDSRVYAMETDLAGASTNPPLSGAGMRFSALAEVRTGAGASFTAKWSQTVQQGATALGTGTDRVDGDTQGVLSLQLDVRF